MRFFVSLTFLGLGGALLHGCGSTSSSCGDLLTCAGPDASTGGEMGQSGAGGGTGGGATGGSAGKGGSTATGGGGGKGAAGNSATGGATGAAGTTAAGGGSIVDAGDGGDGAPSCNGSKSPAVEPCLMTNDHAIFVMKGATNGDGTKEHPMGTIADGMLQATAAHLHRIIVCNATYAENVTIPDANGSLSIYGGFECPAASGDAGADWTPTPGMHAVVAPTSDVPLKITGAKSKIVVSGIDFIAADAPAAGMGEPGKSSIGGIIANSTDVTLVDVTVTAGKGADGAAGADGVKGADGAEPATVPMTAKPASCAMPVPSTQAGATWGGASACGSSGGDGGKAQVSTPGARGSDGFPQKNVSPEDALNGGLSVSDVGKNGTTGSDGSPGVNGKNGDSAQTAGAFASTTYTPADGNAGTDGFTGQGGGGGSASASTDMCIGASGGVGGMGGCGGKHGEGGKGGGASVALISWDSSLVLDATKLTSNDGGAGGSGGKAGKGGIGKGGTLGGDATNGVGRGGPGGAGGNGGDAGAGSGGSGGPSYALVFHGTIPAEITLPVPQHGMGGKKGSGGAAVAGAAAPDGALGAALDRYQVTP